MGSRSTLVGREVPISGSDSVKWLNLSIPPSDSLSNGISSGSSLPPPLQQFPPLTDDYASCSIVGDPPLYLIWRIHKEQPNVLELLELSVQSEFPKIGLRITFPDALFPFAHIHQNQDSTLTNPYTLYVLSVSGVAYLVKLRTVPAYSSISIFPKDELFEFDLTGCSFNAPITSVAATAECLVVGRKDGSAACYRLSLLNHAAPGFANELRDNSWTSRSWGFISRARAVGSVLDLVIRKLYEKPFLFALHGDGVIQIWDLLRHRKVFCQGMNVQSSEGMAAVRFWFGEANSRSDIIPLAILLRHTLESSTEMICVCKLHYDMSSRMPFELESSSPSIPLDEEHCLDVKMSSDKIWILKDTGLACHSIFFTDMDMKETHCYCLQEDFVAEQLFQSAELSSYDLLRMIHSIFSSAKEQIGPFLFSTFLRRLLLPGVYHSNILCSTLLDYNKKWIESEFMSLSVDELKKEIGSLVDDEGLGGTPTSIYYFWKNFFKCYFSYWCKNNSPCGLLVQPLTGSIGLIRKDSVSLFRNMENIELMAGGLPQEFVYLLKPGLEASDAGDREILLEVLKCVTSLSKALGKPASTILYEGLISKWNISLEDVISQLLGTLQTGFTPSSFVPFSDLSADFDFGKNHRNLTKFSVHMTLSLHALSRKANSWGNVLNAIEGYIQFLVPQKMLKCLDTEESLNVGTTAMVQATSQVAQAMFETALDILLFVNYLLKISGKINMLHADVSRIQLEFVPLIQNIVSEWSIIYFLVTTPSDFPGTFDFSCQLSSLHIVGKKNSQSWGGKLGKLDFTLAFILLMSNPNSSQDLNYHSMHCLPNPEDIVTAVRQFTSWIIWSNTRVESNSPLMHYAEFGLTLLRHGQYNAAECLLRIVETNIRRENRILQENDGDWCVLQHVLGCCLLAQARFGFSGMLKERKICEAISSFFRASSGEGASKSLQALSHDTGLPPLYLDDTVSSDVWKLHYFQWVMQIFEQYSFDEGACQFALAALEQVDEATSSIIDGSHLAHTVDESAVSVKGRLWANVFKFTLNLNRFHDAYCAIFSNPDEGSKQICLRHFIIVLHERGAMKVLCDGKLPFTGFAEKIERELARKAECTNVLAQPNLYKMLYAFEMHRQNWRRAASYIYEYSVRLKNEMVITDHQHSLRVLQERLNGISAAINGLHLVHPSYAWIDLPFEKNLHSVEGHSHKRAKKTEIEQCYDHVPSLKLPSYIDLDKLQDEFVLTSAEYALSLANIEWYSTGKAGREAPSILVGILVQANLYDMAFTVILKFWKGSALRRELERIFSAMSLQCCPSIISSYKERNQLLLTSSAEEKVHSSPGMGSMYQQPKGNSGWGTLEFYIRKYEVFHAGLPVTVAETLLRTDSHIELPLWLVQMFKDGRQDRTFGMTGRESNPAALFRLYVECGRQKEAVNLLVEYIDSFATVRPSDLIKRKKPFATWFPYPIVELLRCQLEDSITCGRMVDQSQKLKNMLHGALHNHLKLLKVDSDDALAAAGAAVR